MKKFSITQLLLTAIVLISTLTGFAQKEFKLDRENSSLLITGTSSLHDWEMKAENFSAETILQISDENQVEISRVNFTCDISEIESGKRIMDNKAHDALKENKHPEITFKYDPEQPLKTEKQKGSITGEMKIAGVTRKLKIPFSLDVGQDRFSVKGEVPLKMSDFNIEPPTAMLGAVETGDEIVVKFNFEFDSADQYTRK